MASERERIIGEYLTGLSVQDLGSEKGFEKMVELAIVLDRCKRDRKAITINRDVFRDLTRTYRELNDRSRVESISKTGQISRLQSQLQSFARRANDPGSEQEVDELLEDLAKLQIPPENRLATPFPLGREIAPDPRDRNFQLRALAPLTQYESEPAHTYKYWWPHGWWGDQGYEPQCVGYAWLHYLEGGPITQAPFAWYQGPVIHPAVVYAHAQEIDEWPGTDYEGTSVRAGAKVLKEKGLIESYWWASSMQDIIDAVLTLGPVVVGTWWYWNMFYPDARGFIRPLGQSAGGHAYLIDGVNIERKIFRIKNSWGRKWGRKGFAYITFEDFNKLWYDGAEACLAVEVPDGARRLAEAAKAA